MANVTKAHREQVRKMILNATAKSFLKNGFEGTTVKHIATEAGISTGSFNNHFRTKEDVLYELVSMVLNQQFSVAHKLIEGKTNDKILFYGIETALQLHIVEMNEALRDVYSAAYSLPKTSALIQQTITGKWESIFKDYLPHYETKDFYKLEIATGGIMRGFMTVPCNMWFTMDQKTEAFLECSLRLYTVPENKIKEAIQFTKQFDFETIAKQTIDSLFRYLEHEEDIIESEAN